MFFQKNCPPTRHNKQQLDTGTSSDPSAAAMEGYEGLPGKKL